MGRLENRIAIITGSNSGIGRGVALAYAREGAVVICANRTAESKDEIEAPEGTTHDLIVQNGGRAEFIATTVTDESSVQDLVKAVVGKHGRIDILVNNAGYAPPPMPFWELGDDEFANVLALNVHAVFRTMRAVSRAMMKQEPITAKGERGWIINTGSVFGPQSFPYFCAYGATKMAIMGLAKTAAAELAPHGIHVHTVNPGTVITKATRGMSAQAEEILAKKALLGFGAPEDVAGVYVFLASDEARWMTGNEINADGGFMIK